MLNDAPAPARLLGLGGLIPFTACAAAVWTNIGWVQSEALSLQLGYAAVIVTFLGGVHWGRMLAKDAVVEWPLMIWSVTPSLIAWIALRMHPGPALLLLIGAFALAYLIDRRSSRTGRFPEWYGNLRKVLTLGAMAALVATVIRVWTLPA